VGHHGGQHGMNDRWWAMLLVYPAPLYAGLLVLFHFGPEGFLFPLGFFLTVAFGTATGLGVLSRPILVWAGRLFYVLAGLLLAAFGSPASGGSLDLAVGITVGAPFLWLEYAWRSSSSPGARVLALQTALLMGVVDIATVGAPSSSGSAGEQFVQALAHVLAGQAQGIGALLTGGTPNAMPLESSLDVVFVALGGLALAVVVLSWVSPHTALDAPLPWRWVRYRTPHVPNAPVPEELGLRPGQRSALATRTVPEPPVAMLAPGFGPLIVAAIVVVGFVALAVVEPTVALLALELGTAAALVAVGGVLSRRLTSVGNLSA